MTDLETRFWAKVDKRGPDECWPWIAKANNRGYGVIRLGDGTRNQIAAHRLSYQLTHGPIPKGDGYHGTCILHKCDNPACVNPDHLFAGTNADNARDMISKGRKAPTGGTLNGLAKLSPEDVVAIRASNKNRSDLATEYNLSPAHVWQIRTHRRWAHIP